MFTPLTQILLLVLIGVITWSALVKGSGKDARPRDYLTWLGFALIVFFLILSFVTPNNPAVIAFGSILTFPLKPLGLALLLIFFTLLGEIKKKGNSITNKGINQFWLAFMILVVFSLPLVANLLAQRAEQSALNAYRASLQRQETVDAIVLLGHSSTQLNLLDPNQLRLTDTGDRILQTAQEYRRQRALGCRPLVIVSGGPRPGFEADPGRPQPPEANRIAVTLISMGIPREDIRIEPRSVDIRTGVLEVKKVIAQQGISGPIIVVTSALTGQRATQAFAREGIRIIPSPAGYYALQAGTAPQVRVNSTQKGACDILNISVRNARLLRVSDFIPSAEALLISTRAVNEFWTSVYYFLRGWIATSIEAASQGTDGGC